ncbi:hypothetical protein SAMN06272765_7390 [Streptomyces sp. Ag109_G2-15]|nr:hypothetical protein SAMN06272765_7390 [Streptomyces sp. Ag109_G2-15]
MPVVRSYRLFPMAGISNTVRNFSQKIGTAPTSVNASDQRKHRGATRTT